MQPLLMILATPVFVLLYISKCCRDVEGHLQRTAHTQYMVCLCLHTWRCVFQTDVSPSVRVHSTLDGFSESQTHRQRWMFPKTWKTQADSELTNSLSSSATRSGQPWRGRPRRTLNKQRQELCRCTYTFESVMLWTTVSTKPTKTSWYICLSLWNIR